MIRIIQPGLQTTIQDLGRPGHAYLGVPRSGAADRISLRRANRLLGNATGAAALEMTLQGPHLEFRCAARIAVTGAQMALVLDGQRVTRDGVIEVGVGQRLEVGRAALGARAYLAVAGGLDVPMTLGSRATDVLSGLGPAPLCAGHEIRIGSERGWPVTTDAAVVLDREPVLRLDLGPRADRFETEALESLTQTAFQVSRDSNRVGVRLIGPPLKRRLVAELPSEGITHGAIQVPFDGQPLIFLADHPTTGGYPVIAVLRPESVARAAQLVAGQTVRFALAEAPRKTSA